MEAIIGDFEGTASPSSGQAAMPDPLRRSVLHGVDGFMPCRCRGPFLDSPIRPSKPRDLSGSGSLALLLFKPSRLSQAGHCRLLAAVAVATLLPKCGGHEPFDLDSTAAVARSSGFIGQLCPLVARFVTGCHTARFNSAGASTICLPQTKPTQRVGRQGGGGGSRRGEILVLVLVLHEKRAARVESCSDVSTRIGLASRSREWRELDVAALI